MLMRKIILLLLFVGLLFNNLSAQTTTNYMMGPQIVFAGETVQYYCSLADFEDAVWGHN